MSGHVNQKGDPIVTELMGASVLGDGELREVVDLLLDHLGLTVIRTNATKHGNTVLLLGTASD